TSVVANVGERNDVLWRKSMEFARRCDSIEQLMEKAMQANTAFYEPLPPEEVLKVIASAWSYQGGGRNWVGGKGRATVAREEILAIPGCHSMRLWLLIRASHGQRDGPFAISQIEVAALLGIDQARMPGLIRELIRMGQLRLVHRGKGKGD